MNEALMQDIGLVCAGFAGGMAFLWGWAIVAAGPRAWNPQPQPKPTITTGTAFMDWSSNETSMAVSKISTRPLTPEEAEAMSKGRPEVGADAEIERRA